MRLQIQSLYECLSSFTDKTETGYEAQNAMRPLKYNDEASNTANASVNITVTSAKDDEKLNGKITSAKVEGATKTIVRPVKVDHATNSKSASAKVDDGANSIITSEQATRFTKTSAKVDYGTTSTITSAEFSTFTLLSNPMKGQLLHFLINAVGNDGNPKTTGGDVWCITAYSINKHFFTSGRVLDHQNGSYSAFVFAGWNSKAVIKVKLLYTSHAANFIENNYWSLSVPRVYWTAHFKEGDKTETATCYIGVVSWDSAQVCAYPRPIAMGNHTSFVCDKPPSLPCESLNDYLVNRSQTNKAVEKIGTGNMWLFTG